MQTGSGSVAFPRLAVLGPGGRAGSGGHPVTRLAGLVRGLLHRGGSAVMIFAAALVASAAAATGPAY